MPRASVSTAGSQSTHQGTLVKMLPRASTGSKTSRGAGALRAPAALLPRGEAVASLKELFKTLETTAQGDGEKLDGQIRAAASEALMKHPESDVRLWTAKCLAEGLRIYVPNQPFEDPELRAVILLLLEQIGILREPSSPMFGEALDILQRLADFGGLMLIFECKDQSELLVTLVARCIAAVHATKNADNAHLHTLVIQVLGRVLAEADEIPQSALVTLVEELAPERRSVRGKELACRVLRTLAQGSAALSINEFLNASLYKYAMLDAGLPIQAWDAEEQRETVLAITSELFRIDSALVARVMPNLQMDLENDDVRKRQGATKSIGQMLAHYAGSGTRSLPLMGTHPRLLDKFLDRLHDAEEGVRKNAIDGAAEILATAITIDERDPAAAVVVDAAKRIRDALRDRCLDPNEEIRIRVVQVVAEISLSTKGLDYLEPVLPVAFQRILDKKPRVRDVCIEGCGKVYAKHGLNAWIQGQREQAMRLAFIPQTLFEAYSVFAGARLGHTTQIEKCIEQNLLGFGSAADQRGIALAGLLACVAGHVAGEKGFYQLLDKKREGHAALRRFLSVRLAKGVKSAPVLTTGGIAAHFASNAPAAIEDENDNTTDSNACASSMRNDALMAFDIVARVSPLMEDKNSFVDHSEDFKNLDLVRDLEFWKSLNSMTDPTIVLETHELETQRDKLKDLLCRGKNIARLWPLLRRCLLASWLLPDQVGSLLAVWRESLADDPDMAMVVQRALSVFPKYFPGAFLPHVATIAAHLSDPSTKSVHAALRALAAIGKRRAAISRTPVGVSDPMTFAENLLTAVEALCVEEDEPRCQASVCRKALRALSILQANDAWTALGNVMDWVERHAASAIALKMIAASRDWLLQMPNCPEQVQARVVAQQWVTRAANVLHEPVTPENASMQSSASELLVAAGAEAELVALIDRKTSDSALSMTPRSSEDVQLLHPEGMLLLHACVAILRGIRRGSLQLTTGLLQRVAAQACNVFAPERRLDEIEPLLKELQHLQKPTSSLSSILPLKLTARLRLCATLPTLFAKAATKHHRDLAQRILQASLAKAIRQSSERQQPLLDYAVACFVHFLSRVPAFVEEANMALTAYVESSRISAFFVEALLRTDPSKSADLASTVLRVTERVHHFVDREAPKSDRIQKAAHVLKYVMEKRCPELGKLDVKLQGGGLPAELFSVPEKTLLAPSQIADARQELPYSDLNTPGVDRNRKDAAGGGDSRLPLAMTKGQQSLPPKPSGSRAPLAMTDGRQSSSVKSSVPAREITHAPHTAEHQTDASGGGHQSVAPESSALPISTLASPNVAEEDGADTPGYSDVKPRRLSFPSVRGQEQEDEAVMAALRDNPAVQMDGVGEPTPKRPRTAANQASPGPFQ